MSISLMAEVWTLDLKSPERDLLLALCDHADDSGDNCYPGIDYLSWKLAVSESQVQRTLRALVENQIVLQVQRGNGRGNLSAYKINLEYAPRKAPFAESSIMRKTSISSTSKESNRRYALLKKYGLTIDDYNALLIQQSGCCAICRTPPLFASTLFVGHDHKTGKVRGLLCNACNLGLGSMRDSGDILVGAAAYLNGQNADLSKGAVSAEKDSVSPKVSIGDSKRSANDAAHIRKEPSDNHKTKNPAPRKTGIESSAYDEPYEIFKAAFHGKYHEVYLDKDGDWPNYNRLKKARSEPIDPKEWRIACDNFIASPVSHTLRYFCSLYAFCKHGEVDRYGKLIKPVESPKPTASRDMAVHSTDKDIEELNVVWAEMKAKSAARIH